MFVMRRSIGSLNMDYGCSFKNGQGLGFRLLGLKFHSSIVPYSTSQPLYCKVGKRADEGQLMCRVSRVEGLGFMVWGF